VAEFFRQPAARKLIGRLKKAGVNMTEPEGPERTPLAGKAFVFTGELPGMTRGEASALVKQWGGAVMSAVSAKTDFVVAGAHSGSKYARAQRLNLKILTPDQFKEMMDDCAKT
jgi:DNA ligase (NAD+)